MPRKSTTSKGASGTGSIRKITTTRNGKQYTYWQARYTVGYDPGTGKQIQRSISGKTQKEVAEKLKATTTAMRPSQILCKAPMWCRIEAPHRRFYIWPERIVLQKKTPGGRKSVNCCRWQTSAAWMTFRACLYQASEALQRASQGSFP